MKIVKAEIGDLAEILALQKLAYQSEAELVGDYTITPLTQTLEGMAEDFDNGVILNAVDGGEIVGSVRVRLLEGTLHIGRLIVVPTRQNRGVGAALLLAAEELYPGVRCELFTSERSAKNLHLYMKHGYKEFKRGPLNGNVSFVFLEKN